MDLATGRVITRPKVRVIPVTDTIITRVKEMANEQGIKTVKFLNRKRQQLFNNIGLTAGVVHEHEEHNKERERKKMKKTMSWTLKTLKIWSKMKLRIFWMTMKEKDRGLKTPTKTMPLKLKLTPTIRTKKVTMKQMTRTIKTTSKQLKRKQNQRNMKKITTQT